MEHLDSIAVFRLELPLAKPYRLAFGAVERYDTLIVAIMDRDGRDGFGEATVLTGYTDETIDDAWRVAREFASRIIDEPAAARGAAVGKLAVTHPFTATAFGTAFEMLADPARFVASAASVPLLALVDAQGEDAIASQLDRLIAEGYGTVKLKVGFDAAADARFVAAVQRASGGRLRIRVDANQGYDAKAAIAFVSALDPAGIELFEQPCAAGDWDAHLQVAQVARVPLMLDESIYGMADIEKTAKLACAQFIKLKLMKFATLDALAAGIARIRELGLEPVLGNGVACDVGCWHEALVATRLIDNAGEMNGFLKTRGALLENPLVFEKGAIRLEAGYRPRLDMEAVRHYSVDSLNLRAGTRQASA